MLCIEPLFSFYSCTYVFAIPSCSLTVGDENACIWPKRNDVILVVYAATAAECTLISTLWLTSNGMFGEWRVQVPQQYWQLRNFVLRHLTKHREKALTGAGTTLLLPLFFPILHLERSFVIALVMTCIYLAKKVMTFHF